MVQEIIGRKTEIRKLTELYQSKRPVFAVVYGRRRVGKTYLIRELFDNQFSFYHTGLSPYELQDENLRQGQLSNFFKSLVKFGSDINHIPADWFEAFDALTALLEQKPKEERKLVFIDEMPWLDSPRSGFVTAFEHFWNGWGSGRSDLMLVACGSATSWISDNLLNNTGGLFNRVTHEIKLLPFDLSECEEYVKANEIVMSRYDLVECYMIMGGIPFYLSLLEKGMSLPQNIDNLFFAKSAKLRNEFERLFSSLFKNKDDCMKIVRLLSQKNQGYTRQEIVKSTQLPNGGGLSYTLRSLEASDFIMSYTKYGRASREVYFRLTDSFTKFYLTFVDGARTKNPVFWQNNFRSPRHNAWKGFAFENLCFYHFEKIKESLGIRGVQTECSPWKSRQEKDGAQIDMLIVRADNVIDVCEMKFSSDEYTITAGYDRELRHKIELFNNETKCKQTIHLIIVTTFGLKFNEYSGQVQQIVTMDDFFK